MNKEPAGKADALVLAGGDDVATALRPLETGQACVVRGPGTALIVEAAEPIPFGHKLALRALPAGTVVRKYGEAVGSTRVDVARGAHVHIHNLASLRARH